MAASSDQSKVVDGDGAGAGAGDGSAPQLCQHRNDPGKEFERLPMQAFLKPPEGTDHIEHRGDRRLARLRSSPSPTTS